MANTALHDIGAADISTLSNQHVGKPLEHAENMLKSGDAFLAEIRAFQETLLRLSGGSLETDSKGATAPDEF